MHGKQTGNKGFSKTQKMFVPKNQSQNHEQSRNPTPDATPTLSNSLRQSSSLSKQSDAATVSSGACRVRKGKNGDWVSNRAPGGSFVNYLPQDEAVAAGLGADEGGLDPVESQRVVDLLNRELSRLLKLKPREFWREVASDFSLHEFLDSFLQFRSRWYDFPHHGVKGTVAGVIVGEFELSRRAFMVLYRISSNTDPGTRAADSLSPKDHEVLLQEKKLLDLPKLLDICAIYGHENEDLTRILVGNAFRAQPRMHSNLTSIMSHFLNIIHTMHQRCSSSLEVLSFSTSHGDNESSRLCADMLEVMDFINDAIVSMDALVSAYKPATLFFSSPVEISYGNEELLGTLVKLHDSLLPSLKRGFQMILTSEEDGMASNIGVSLKMLSMRISNFGWKLLEFCYLSDAVFKDNLPIPAATKMFPVNVEDPVIRADILVQTFREISEVSLHKEENQNWETFLQKVEKNFCMMRKMENLQNTGWIFMDDEQLEYLSVIFKGSKKITTNEPPHNVAIPVTSSKVKMDEDAAIMESKIGQIKDLFPDYGRGFLVACLEAYNQNPEEVIQRILEGTLHEDLQSLDTSLEKMPAPKTTMTIGKNDKGKGKLIEPETLPSTNLVPTRILLPNEGPSISSSYSVGRFVRKSKADTNSDSLDARNETDLAVNAALISQYEYEDEYDDSFDDLGLSVAESGFEENEILSDKMSSNVGKPWEKETETSQIPPSSKWGSRKKPQYYVKDGKNYSYKVEGAVAVANAGEASIVTQAQKELIYGLGHGGNLPLGAVKKLTEASEQQDKQPDFSETLVRGFGNPRGRARRGGGRHREPPSVEQDQQSGVSEVEGRENLGTHRVRGRGRRGGGGGRNNNNYRKDRSMNKHFSGLSGY